MRIEVVQGVDECGDPEMFTWDLLPVVDPSVTLHLNEDGLPLPGTKIVPGMILVGRIGKTNVFDSARRPNALELQADSFEELRRKFGSMWRDNSLYATDDTCGWVTSAELVRVGETVKAVVELHKEPVPALLHDNAFAQDGSVVTLPVSG
jgi:DNA-directed RNA polymerase beta subunit